MEIVIHINKYNFCYLEELVNYYLVFVRGQNIRVPDLLDSSQKDFFEAYSQIVQKISDYLRPLQMRVEISGDVISILKQIASAMAGKGQGTASNVYSPSKIFQSLEELKKLPHSFLTTVRYLSLFTEDVIVGPRQVVLDIYHQCNTDCIHCWIHSPTAKKFLSKGFTAEKMDFQRVKGIVDDCAEMGVDTLTLLGDGEPMLNPDFLKMLEYIKGKNPYIDVLTFSNGLTVTPAASDVLIRAGLNEIWFSIPAATAGTYTQICPSKSSKDFEKIKQNIAYLCTLKNKIKKIDGFLNFSKEKALKQRGGREAGFPPYCVIAFVLHNKNYHEIVEMARMAVELGVDEMRFQLIHLDKDNKWLQLEQEQLDFLNEKLGEVKAIAEKGKVVLSSALKFQLLHMYAPTGDWSKGYYLAHGCPIGFFFSIIKANGDIGLCCSLKVIDTLKNRSFHDIWFSKEYRKARTGAKYLKENKDLQFVKTDYHKDESRGDCLYSERCEYCDNHDMNNEIINALSRTNLFDLFMKK
jgi:MoaA/NifB/PqqE/SkfB family radical SAM enzyme